MSEKGAVIFAVYCFLKPSINKNISNWDQEFLPQNGNWTLAKTDTGNLTCHILLHCQYPKFSERLQQSRQKMISFATHYFLKYFLIWLFLVKYSVYPQSAINMDIIKRLRDVIRWKYTINCWVCLSVRSLLIILWKIYSFLWSKLHTRPLVLTKVTNSRLPSPTRINILGIEQKMAKAQQIWSNILKQTWYVREKWAGPTDLVDDSWKFHGFSSLSAASVWTCH